MRGALLSWLLVLAPLTAIAQGGEPSDTAIDERLRASAEAAQNLQGPLDGGWTLVSAAGAPIYAFQIVDTPGGADPLEGVWRDLRRPMTPGDIGPVDVLQRGAGSLTIRFTPMVGKPATTVSLTSGVDGLWTGELSDAGEPPMPVRLRRN
jgi:hypothetical protein